MKRWTIVAVLWFCQAASAEFLGTWKINDYVGIPATTHRFSTGAAYQPTAITYSIYADGSTTGIDEGVNMTPASPHDSVVGLYYARRQLTAAAGFEAGKNYLVVIKATVDGVDGVATHTFQIEAGETTAIKAVTDKLDTMLEADDANYKFTADAVQEVSLGDDAMTEEEFNALLLAYWDPSTDPVILTADYDPAKTAAQASTALSNVTWTDTLAGYLDAAISSRSSHSAADAATAVLAATVDGTLTVDGLLERLAAFLLGKATVSTGATTSTITFYKQDDTTMGYSVTSSNSTGARAAKATLE